MPTYDRFAGVASQIDDWIGASGVPGAAIAVSFQGETVAEHYAGEASPGLPIDERTLFGLASVTKPVTAAAVLSCVEEGCLALDEPVATFIPEFPTSTDTSIAGYDPDIDAHRAEVTVRQLLSHLSGLPEDLPAGYLNIKTKPSLHAYTDAMQRQPLTFVPGTALRYSNAGYALLARIVERITGNDFWLEADRRIIEPLGVRDIVARPGPALDERIPIVADVARAGSDVASYNSDYWRQLAIPWGGLYGSARDLMTFATAFLPNGPRILSEAATQAMITDQAHGVAGGVGSLRLHWDTAFWGLGWEVRGTKSRHWTGDLASPATYCHFGAAGTLLWADPTRELVVAVFANRTTAHLWPFVPPRWARLNNALVSLADQFR